MMDAPNEAPKINDAFLFALAMVESQGKDVVGDGGLAIGPYQIHPIYRQEANRLLRGPVFNDDDRHSYLASKEMSRVVLANWTRYWRKKGHKIGYAEMASLHRHPSHRWKPGNLNTPLERGRTSRLKKFMEIFKKPFDKAGQVK